MKQIDLFSLMPDIFEEATKPATSGEQAVKVKELPHISPLAPSVQPKLTLEWISYVLAKLKGDDGTYYALVLPAKDADGAVKRIESNLKAAGISPSVPWDEQGVSMLKKEKTYPVNEMVKSLYGMEGNINGRYAIKPICPLCGKAGCLTDIMIAEQPYLPVVAATHDCEHKSIAIMVFLPGYQYAQHIFEAIGK